MALEIPVDDLDTENVGGYDKVAPGSYHMAITHVDENGGRKGEMIVKTEVLRGTTTNQESKEIAHYFANERTPLARRKILALAIAAGLTTKQELDQHKANGTSPTLDFNSIVGKQVCMNLEDNEYEGKHTTRLAWDEIYHPADKRASHIPLSVPHLKKAGIVLPPGRNPDGAVKSTSSPSASEKATTKAKPEPAKQAASVDELFTQ